MSNNFNNNRSKAEQWLGEGELMVLCAGNSIKSSADETYDYRVNQNFYYFTGLNREAFILVMYKIKSDFKTMLFIEKPNEDVEKWYGRKLSKEAAKDISGIEEIKYLEDFKPWLVKNITEGKINKVFLDLEKHHYDEPDSETHRFSKEITEKFPFINIGTFHPFMCEQRMVKEPYEIELTKQAIELTRLGLNAILKVLRPSLYEYQLDATFKHSIAFNGAQGVAFPTIAASGENAVILHYIENDQMLNDGDLVLLDLGAKYKGYCGDITRTYPVNGRFTKRQKQLYQIVLEAQQATIAVMKPGTPFEKLNEVCKATLMKGLKEVGLITKDEELSKYYYHGVSHHLGLNVHDISHREMPLQPGMILTVEPGLYIAEENIGIRIEDDIHITKEGAEILSKAIPKEIDEIEAIMRQQEAQ
jgi:Xaa-Pro aminopeptidase